MLGSRKNHDMTIHDEEDLPAVSVTITPIGSENEELAADIAADLEAKYAADADHEGDDV